MTGEIVMNGVPYRPLGDACKSMRWGGFSSSEESPAFVVASFGGLARHDDIIRNSNQTTLVSRSAELNGARLSSLNSWTFLVSPCARTLLECDDECRRFARVELTSGPHRENHDFDMKTIFAHPKTRVFRVKRVPHDL